MVPKPFQNRSWRGSGGHLGATLETRCFQDLIFDDFGSILGPPLGPVWAHFGHHVFDAFLNWLFDGLGLHLGSQNTSKMSPKRGPKLKHENHWFCHDLLHLDHIWGSRKSSFLKLFWYPFPSTVSEPLFDRFWTLLATLLDPFGHPNRANFDPKRVLKPYLFENLNFSLARRFPWKMAKIDPKIDPRWL